MAQHLRGDFAGARRSFDQLAACFSSRWTRSCWQAPRLPVQGCRPVESHWRVIPSVGCNTSVIPVTPAWIKALRLFVETLTFSCRCEWFVDSVGKPRHGRGHDSHHGQGFPSVARWNCRVSLGCLDHCCSKKSTLLCAIGISPHFALEPGL